MRTEIKHTPTPWRIHNIQDDQDGDFSEQVWTDEPHGAIQIAVCASGDNLANAEHIVKCVNLHDELVAICERCAADDPHAYHEARRLAKALLAKVKP